MRLQLKSLVISTAACLVACEKTEPVDVPAGVMIPSSVSQRLLVADEDNGTISVINARTSQVTEVEVGSEPTRMTRIGKRVYVTLRGERSVMVLVETEEGLVVEQVVEVGAEPYGIIASPDGSKIYVVLSQEGVVLEMDAETMEVLRVFEVPGEPRWITIHPSGNYIYIATATGEILYQVNLENGKLEKVPLPEASRPQVTFDTGGSSPDEPAVLTPRVTGDLDISTDGDTLAVPGLYVDTTTPAGGVEPEPQTNTGYGASVFAQGVGRFNPVVVAFNVDASGKISTRNPEVTMVDGFLSSDDGEGSSNIVIDSGFFETDFGSSRGSRVRGYLSGVVFDPQGHFVYAGIEGSSAIAVVPTHATNRTEEGTGIRTSNETFITTSEGAKSVSVGSDGQVYAYGFIGRSVSSFRSAEVNEEFQNLSGTFPGQLNLGTVESQPVATLPESRLPESIQLGRRLFYTTSNSAMTNVGAGVSCATCHSEGRNDGLTWTFDHGVRQTPSLAGEISKTHPITWSNGVETVMDEVFVTSEGRMGGQGISVSEAASVSAYIDWVRDVDVPDKGLQTEAIARGKMIFESEEAGCASCHLGERYTDNRFYSLLSPIPMNTPGLVGIAATAPYYHDGRASTLEQAVLMADDLGMGRTKHLSESEKADLVAYLRSL